MEPGNNISSPMGGTPQVSGDVQHEKTVRFRIAVFGFFLFIVFVIGLFWMFTTPDLTVGLTLSFVSGLSMIFLPCTLPLAFVIVPLTMGKDPKKGLLMALFFTLGLTITLSFYGVFIAALGKSFGLTSNAEVYAVLLGGIAAFSFGLSEIGLLKFKLPSYSGKFPDFIQRRKDYVKTFLLGLLLGNAGVGCPNPAFYILLGYIATTADLFNGWFLGFVHGVGRSVPLIFLAILGTLGVNALSGVARHKEGVERAMGWALVIIGAYLLTFGIFGHDWFIASGIHSAWEQFVSNIGGERFGETILKHTHKLIDVPNMIKYGNMFFLSLLALTFIVAFAIQRTPRRTIFILSVIYAVIALIIGQSTGWTFQTAAKVHIQFHGSSAAPPGNGGHTTAPSGKAGHGAMTYQEEAEVKEGLAINLNVAPTPIQTGQTQKFDFLINEKPGARPVAASELEVDHTVLMHVVGVRSDLNEFFHIHPEPTSTLGVLSKEYVFAKPGLYKIWSEVKKDGEHHVIGHPEISVSGEGKTEEKQTSFARNVIVGNYQASLAIDEPVVRDKEHDLSFDIQTPTGREVEVEKYLDAKMHLSIIKDDWKEFIHAHPGNGEEHSLHLIPEVRAHGAEEEPEVSAGADETINFHVVFPQAGLYKVFAQFRPKGIDLPAGEALTAAFWIEVKEDSGTRISSWWLLLFASLIAIILLSLAVRRYLRA